MVPRRLEWAYEFACSQPLSAILVRFNAAGPWQWQGRDSDFYGDYLLCRPKERVRLRVHEWPWNGILKFAGTGGKGFRASLEVESGSEATRPDIDQVFLPLLDAVNATDVTEIEPYY